VTTRDPRYWTPEWKALRRWVLRRDREMCQIRGPKCTHHATEADHIVSVADGGDFFDPANLRAACRPCNAGRGAERTNTKRRYRTSVPDYETRM
jgi:5-methylcytosine-specific restriction enzyme A